MFPKVGRMFSESMRLINSVAANSGGSLYSCADIGRLFTNSTRISSHLYIFIYRQTFIYFHLSADILLFYFNSHLLADFLPTQHVFHHIYIFAFIDTHLYIYIYWQTFYFMIIPNCCHFEVPFSLQKLK